MLVIHCENVLQDHWNPETLRKTVMKGTKTAETPKSVEQTDQLGRLKYICPQFK